jgi:hypothetical protein
MEKNVLKNLVKNISSFNKRKDKETKIDKIKSHLKVEKIKKKRSRSRSRENDKTKPK